MSEQYLSDKDLARRYKNHRKTIWQWVKEGNFPKPVKLGANTSRWSLKTVEAHEKELANG